MTELEHQPRLPAFLTPQPTQRLRLGGPLADIMRLTNLLTYLLPTHPYRAIFKLVRHLDHRMIP